MLAPSSTPISKFKPKSWASKLGLIPSISKCLPESLYFQHQHCPHCLMPSVSDRSANHSRISSSGTSSSSSKSAYTSGTRSTLPFPLFPSWLLPAGISLGVAWQEILITEARLVPDRRKYRYRLHTYLAVTEGGK
jgi:hypothetical protein